jgi:hypothetical protein
MKLDPYPFKDNLETVCFSCRHVVHESKPILLVSHEEGDEAWQFMCGAENHEESDAVITTLKVIYEHDTTIKRLADMPLGLYGIRADINSEWKFYKNNNV